MRMGRNLQYNRGEMRALFLTLACAALVLAQPGAKTHTATKTGTKAGAAPASRNLLNPAALRATAPAEYKVKFTTTKGDFVVEVHRDWAPNGADRFYNMVRAGYFDGVRFFRAVQGFMVQFGISPRVDVNRAWLNAKIKDDPAKPGISNLRGYVSFASAGPNTRTTQVFINLVDNQRLDPMGFTPFGKVVEGMETVDKFYTGYGEATTNDQGNILNGGEAYLAKKWPNTDKILTARVEPGAEPAKPAAAKRPATKAATPAKK
jgi:peptidyl-prolyl cis-trans isomerase A (cyclophilin A)